MPNDCATLTHIAGNVVTIDGRTVQRCSLCGAKLIDSQGQAGPLNPDGSPPAIATWPVGQLVEVEAGQPTRYTLLEWEGGECPANICVEFA